MGERDDRRSDWYRNTVEDTTEIPIIDDEPAPPPEERPKRGRRLPSWLRPTE